MSHYDKKTYGRITFLGDGNDLRCHRNRAYEGVRAVFRRERRSLLPTISDREDKTHIISALRYWHC